MPIGHTCGWYLEFHRYSSYEKMVKLFKTAILLCGEIDDDGYYGDELGEDDYLDNQGEVKNLKDYESSMNDISVNGESDNDSKANSQVSESSLETFSVKDDEEEEGDNEIQNLYNF